MHRHTNRREFLRNTTLAGAGLVAGGAGAVSAWPRKTAADSVQADVDRVFRAGAAAVDVSPRKLPVLNSGGFLERVAHAVNDPLYARGLVLDDGVTRVAILVVDSPMMPREMLDRVKQTAGESTGIPPDRMLISATHTHAAPSVMGALGTGVDHAYVEFLPGRIVECIQEAANNLAPARVGWGTVVDSKDTNCRVWIRRPDRIGIDPFGEATIRAMMVPGYQNPDYIGPCGPEDPELSVLAVQSADGVPVAVLANYAMHYFGARAVSSDYFGPFAEKLEQLIAPDGVNPPLVGMMSHGTSGDQQWWDFSQPQKQPIDIDTYAGRVAQAAFEAYNKIEYHDWVPIAMAEKRLTLDRRVPSDERLAWAEEMIASMQGRTKPKSRPEVYALEQIYLRDEPWRDLTLQALRIGDFGITAIPNEVYAITGLKLKAQSPLVPTMNIELAGGGEGYIPPPELFPFGGYNAWPARTAGLEFEAEPKIVEAVLGLLEEVAGRPRRKIPDAGGPYAGAVLRSGPIAYWQMRNTSGPRVNDLSQHNHHGVYEAGVAYYLEGPELPGLCAAGQTSRAAHFAGGRMRAAIEDLAGKLFFYNGNVRDEFLVGTSRVPLKIWTHAVLVRDGAKVAAYLNGSATPEFSGPTPPKSTATAPTSGRRCPRWSPCRSISSNTGTTAGRSARSTTWG